MGYNRRRKWNGDVVIMVAVNECWCSGLQFCFRFVNGAQLCGVPPSHCGVYKNKLITVPRDFTGGWWNESLASRTCLSCLPLCGQSWQFAVISFFSLIVHLCSLFLLTVWFTCYKIIFMSVCYVVSGLFTSRDELHDFSFIVYLLLFAVLFS